MSNTKREPYLNDDQLQAVVDLIQPSDNVEVDMERVAVDVRSLYEAELAKNAELIQRLVDALVDHPPGTCTAKEWQAEIADALAAAEAAGFKPSGR